MRNSKQLDFFIANNRVRAMRYGIVRLFGIVAMVFVSSFLLWVGNAAAEVAARDNGNQAALAKAQYMLREISMEKEALQAENQQLKDEIEKRDKKIEAQNKKIARANKSLDNTQEMVGKYQEAVAAQKERMVEMRDKFQKLVDKYKELVSALRLVENERANLQRKTQVGLRTLQDCASNNQSLYQANMDILKQYENKGVWDAVMQKEPVTQLKRVEIENFIEDMKYRIEKLKVDKTVTASIN